MPSPGSIPPLGRTRAADQVIAGKYRLTRMLGRGGMGSVWEGVHASLGTRVAIKFIDSGYVDSADARQRFANEARATARLDSKHVVKVFDHGVTEEGHPWIVMEFLQGEPLDRRLTRVGRLPAADTARIIKDVCRALAKAHAAGIVHRDLKPENIFLVWDDDDRADLVKVVDFGIAKFTDNAPGVSSSTRTGAVLGTPYYMSPEQARGLRSVDHRSDLWSVGVITYRCITGALPFEGEALGDLLVKLCTAPLPVPSQVTPDVPPGFDAWFQKALNREPAERFGGASELAEALTFICSGTQPSADTGGEQPARAQPAVSAATLGSPLVRNVSQKTRSGGARVGFLLLGLTVLLATGAGVAFSVLGSSDEISEVNAAAGPTQGAELPAVAKGAVAAAAATPAPVVEPTNAPAHSVDGQIEPAPHDVPPAGPTSDSHEKSSGPRGGKHPSPARPSPPRGQKLKPKEPDLGY